MLKRFSVLILSAATLAACSESTLPTDGSPLVPSGRALLAELTCNADVAAQRISCAPATPSLAGASADLIIGGQNVYTKLTSTNVVNNGTTLTGDVTVQNLTAQPWATTDGATPTTNGVRVFVHTPPNNGVTIANFDGTGTFTASNQQYFQYNSTALGADGILSSNEVSSSKSWQFNLNGAPGFTFQVYVTTQLPDEGGVLRWTASTVAQAGLAENINAIWGASSSDVWIAGKDGSNVLQHWNGTSWTSYAGAETVDMVALWGSGSSDVYAVGGTKMQHWNGSAWADTASASTTSLLAIWGSSATDVYACGKTGTLVHSSGGAFTAVAGNPLAGTDCTTIWGSSASDIYIGETNVYHYDGTNWNQISPGISNIRAIWGTSANDIWIGGTGGNVVHYDGTSWSAPITVGNTDVGGIWGTSTSDVYLANRAGSIWHYNGSSWVRYRNPADSYVGVWGGGRTDVWVVGADSAFKINKVYHGTR
ncbi:MAG TPA: hypothetical protein VF461_10200 [Gemmatimonadaceae bacterium]